MWCKEAERPTTTDRNGGSTPGAPFHIQYRPILSLKAREIGPFLFPIASSYSWKFDILKESL
jgi:hypothetical protein